MTAWNLLRDRLRALLRRDTVIRDIDEELRSHVELATEANLAQGMTPDAARAAALASFGNVAVVRDAGYDVRGGGWLEAVWLDVRFAIRSLRRQKTVTIAALLTWALGIGAAIAVFSVVQPVLLKPLPFADADRLVTIVESCLPKFTSFSVAPGNFVAWRERDTAFAALVVTQNVRPTLRGAGGDPDRLRALLVSDGFFDLFGVTPRLGRAFRPDEDAPGHESVVILSDGFWQRRFGGDPHVIGTTVTLEDKPVTVIGVMPPGLHPLVGIVDLWQPLAMDAKEKQAHGRHYMNALGRLKPGVSIAGATASLDAVAKGLEEELPKSNTGWRVVVEPMNEGLVGKVRPILVLLSAAVVFVLLIAGANVASLLIGRTASREREIAVRAALGAGRWRIVRQLACESLLLAVLGGAMGLGLGLAGVRVLLSLAPQGIGGLTDVTVDLPLCAFAVGLSILVGLVVALAPAHQAARADLGLALKEGHAGMVGKKHARVRRTLVVVEIAACLLLLINAGLLVRSLGRLISVDPGFQPERVLTMELETSDRKYPDDASRRELYVRALDSIRTLPGVVSVAATQSLPFDGDWVGAFSPADRPEPEPGKEPSANYYVVSNDYFSTLGIQLLGGRLFNDRDTAGAPRVVIVNDKLAREQFPGTSAIGKRLRFNDDAPEEIVGVVADVKHYGLDRETTYQIYEPHRQSPIGAMYLLVRGVDDPAQLGAGVRARIAAVDDELPVSRLRPYAQIVSDSLARQRFAVTLLGIFAAVALCLGVVGIYGVIADAVTQRTREIGVRMALGASRGHVVRAMMRVGLMPALAGLAIGLLGALAATRLVGALLFGVGTTDALTWLGASAALLLAAALAAYVPARRATRIDPMVALRYS